MEYLTYEEIIEAHLHEEVDLVTLVTDYGLNLSRERAERLNRRGYNCMGFALNTFNWEGLYDFEDTWDGDFEFPMEERNAVCRDCADEILSLSNEQGYPPIREVDSEADLQDGEYLMAFRIAADDFHFMRRMPDGRWFEKCGSTILRECTDRVFDDEWACITGETNYNSDIYLFAVKKVA